MTAKVLLLSFGFPPMAAPEAILSAKRLGNLRGCEVDVICAEPLAGAIRIDHSLDDYVARRFKRIVRLEVPPALRILARRKFSALFQVPGLQGVMNRKALHAAMQLGPENYDAIVSWSQWHSIHLVGLSLKRHFPRLRWIAHFSDPWSDNPFAPAAALLKPYYRSAETKVFRFADALSFTSAETIDLVCSGDRSPFRAKAFELPHGFEPDLYPPATPRSAGPLIVRSLGNFYGARSPEPLFRALAMLRERVPSLFGRMRVELIGSIPEPFRQSKALMALPKDAVRLVSPVDYTTSLALMRSADLLLNIDAPFEHSVFLPSKLVDYIGAQRPVLGITPPGAAARVILSLGGWVAGPNDPAGIATALETALGSIEQRGEAPWGAPEIRRTYLASNVGEQFARLALGARP